MTRLLACVVLLVFLIPGMTLAEVTSADVAAHRAELERQLQAIEADIAAQRGVLSEKQKERQSLERDIGLLDAEIRKAQLSIKARDLSIVKLSDDISLKSKTIRELDEKILRERESLAEILRKTHLIDEHTVAEFALRAEGISEFYGDLDSFAVIQRALSDSFIAIAEAKEVTSRAKSQLEERVGEEEDLKQLQLFEKQKIEKQQKERSSILKVTKGVEKVYQDVIKASERSAAQIRSELFGLRDSAAIPFGTALDLANQASRKTGVRAALILGVLKQETELGENLGTGTWSIDMHPTRDVPVYKAITEALGYNPDRMPVSKQPGYGWGGAMGPGQFIPSTWACYGGFINTTTGKCGKGTDGTYAGPWAYDENKDIIRRALGKSTPSDPWQNADAFMATALLMKENGAAAGTPAAERLAALRYFAGWGNANKSAYAFYGDGVMKHAEFFQSQITILGAN
ncbi:MAG: hypothetical protein AAB573_03480 [Patescibacteria group bacterium]